MSIRCYRGQRHPLMSPCFASAGRGRPNPPSTSRRGPRPSAPKIGGRPGSSPIWDKLDRARFFDVVEVGAELGPGRGLPARLERHLRLLALGALEKTVRFGNACSHAELAVLDVPQGAREKERGILIDGGERRGVFSIWRTKIVGVMPITGPCRRK